MSERPTEALLKAFLDAFNRHDLDAIMEFFADDCVFYMPRGAAPRGDRYAGKTDVRAGLATRFAGIPDVRYGDDRHWVGADFGVATGNSFRNRQESCASTRPVASELGPDRVASCWEHAHNGL